MRQIGADAGHISSSQDTFTIVKWKVGCVTGSSPISHLGDAINFNGFLQKPCNWWDADRQFRTRKSIPRLTKCRVDAFRLACQATWNYFLLWLPRRGSQELYSRSCWEVYYNIAYLPCPFLCTLDTSMDLRDIFSCCRTYRIYMTSSW